MARPSTPGDDPRARHLLRTLIGRYIRDGEPVGSQTLARHAGLDISPATIRTILTKPQWSTREIKALRGMLRALTNPRSRQS